jgi:hypothetical protein
MLKSLRAPMSEESASQFIIAHLRDTLRRAGEDPDQFTLFQHDRFGPALHKVLNQLKSDPDFIFELVELSSKRELETLTATFQPSRGARLAGAESKFAGNKHSRSKADGTSASADDGPERLID